MEYYQYRHKQIKTSPMFVCFIAANKNKKALLCLFGLYCKPSTNKGIAFCFVATKINK